MTQPQRALQFWSVLAFAAREQKVVSYEMLEQLTGMVAQGTGDPLGHIAAYCDQNGLPLLNTLAISKRTGKPSPEFLKGIDPEREQARAFMQDWLSLGAPSAEQLEAAFTRAKIAGTFSVPTP